MSALTGYFVMNGIDSVEDYSIDDFHAGVDVQRHRGLDNQKKYGISFCQKTFEELENHQCKLDGLLGFCQMKIEDTDEDQPFISNDKKVILAYDGEIYNYAELQNQLSLKTKIIYKNKKDVMLDLYYEYGLQKMVKMLNGIFSLVLIDLEKETINLVNDRYGAKPLYYAFDSHNRLYFSSEMKAIIQFRNFERKIDLNAYNARLVFARPGTKVLLENVNLVPAGTIVQLSKYGKRSEQYFSLNDINRDYEKYSDVDRAVEELDYLIEKAVARQLPNKKKLGIQLSGGIDSTLLAYYAKKIKGSEFSEAFGIVDGRGEEGEEKYIRIVGDKLKMNLHTTVLTPDYFFKNYERMIWHNDAPAYRPYFACFMKLGEIAKQYASVLYCGEGADEIAGGYSRFAGGVLDPILV